MSFWNRPYTLEQYHDYIANSQIWQFHRYQCMRRAGYRCEHCGAENVSLDIHHTQYAYQYPLGEEPVELLRCWCGQCHDKYHSLLRRKEQMTLNEQAKLPPKPQQSYEEFCRESDLLSEDYVSRKDLIDAYHRIQHILKT